MLAVPYIKALEAPVLQWEAKLLRMQLVLDEWLACQVWRDCGCHGGPCRVGARVRGGCGMALLRDARFGTVGGGMPLQMARFPSHNQNYSV